MDDQLTFPTTEAVLVTHGYTGHRWMMMPLVHHLRQAHFEVVNWGYRSIWRDIESHATAFREQLDRLCSAEGVDRVHIVAHSMGAIVARQALLNDRPNQLGRIVMLGPPNRGSHVARIYAGLFGWMSKPLQQISDGKSSFVNQLADDLAEHCEVGIIAAQTDFVVRHASTPLPNSRGRITLPGLHSSMLWRERTAQETIYFLQHGHFSTQSAHDNDE